MNKIIGERSSGKTLRLMLLAIETGATIVCSNPEAFYYKAQAYGYNDITFISYEDYFIHRGEKDTKYLIDEVDGLLQAFDNNIIGYCATQDS